MPDVHVLAALGDVTIAVIAVAAILLGVLLAARGPREKRVAAGSVAPHESGPRLEVPVAAAPDAEPGFVGPEGTVVGHGPIRVGGGGALGAGEPAAREPEAEPQPAAPAPDATGEAPPDVAPPAEEARAPAEPPPPKDPAWRVAARAANPAARFRRGAIKIGGRAAGKRKDS